MNVEFGTEAALLFGNTKMGFSLQCGGGGDQCWFTCCAHKRNQFAGLTLIKCVTTDLVLFTLCIFISQLSSKAGEGRSCPVRYLPATEGEVAWALHCPYINKKFCGTPLLPSQKSACKRYGEENSSVLLLAYSLTFVHKRKDGKDMIGGMEKKGGRRRVVSCYVVGGK